MAEENNNKPSYEQLYEFARQASEQNENLNKQLRDQRLGEIVAQLNFLFKVVELKASFPEEYVDNCVKEIQKILVISNDETPAETTQEEVKEGKSDVNKKSKRR